MSTVIGLTLNLGVLALGALVLFLLGLRYGTRARGPLRDLVVGLVLGGMTFAVVVLPLVEPLGATFDARAAPALLAGLIGGPIGAFVAAALGGLGRAVAGGPWTFGGVVSVFIYALLGLAVARWRARRADAASRPLRLRGYLALSAVASILIIPCIFTGPTFEKNLEVFLGFWPALVLHNLVATAILGRTFDALRDAIRDRDETRALLQMHTLARDAAGVGFWRYDFQTDRLDWDETLHVLTGTSAGAFDGSLAAFDNLVHPEDRERAMRKFLEAAATNASYEDRFRIVRPDGAVRRIKSACAFAGGAPGRPDYAVGVDMDVTHTHELLEELALKGAALDHSVCGIVVARAESGHPTVYVNEAFTRMTGFTREEILGRNCRVLGEAARDENAMELVRLRTALSEGDPVEVTLRNSRRDGSTFWNRLSVSPIRDEAGVITHFIGVQDDVTDERSARDAIQTLADSLKLQLAASEAANEAKSRFLAVMSHELRTPLNGALGMAQLLATSSLDATQARKVDTILTCGRALLAIIEDILEISMLESGVVSVAEAPVDLPVVVEEAIAAVAADAARKSVEIEVDVAPPLRVLRFVSDAYRIRQILVNLLANALKFSDRGPIRLSVEIEASEVIIRVADRGVGIPPEALDAIFDRFTQADQSLTRRHGGVGLGLAICREVATLLGGAIDVESELGVGSTFRVRLPLRLVSPAAAPAVIRSPVRDRLEALDAEVVIVDDDASSRELATNVARSLGLRVRAYPDAMAALREAHAWRRPLMLVNFRMPELGGEGLLRTLRARPDLAHVPMAVVTADARLGSEDVEALGADALFLKPVDVSALRSWLRRAAAEPTRRRAAAFVMSPAPTEP